jgi:CRISPR/Cas system endoribonuclease Cas6 (RAMP superfamily)
MGEDDMRISLVERHTQPSSLSLVGRGGKLKAMRGWVGHMIVDCNAPAHWLLEVAARVGLGGRTAFGFGRVRVSNAD